MTDKKECVVCGEEFDTSWETAKHEFQHTKEQTLGAIKRIFNR